MPDQLNERPGRVLLVGAGPMAISYASVLDGLGVPLVVAGRGKQSADAFTEATGHPVGTGDLTAQLTDSPTVPSTAIVAVNAMYLTDVAEQLAAVGVKRMLLEKPGALDRSEAARLNAVAAGGTVEMVVGYNRRFAESVRHVRKMVEEDGGLLSAKFDFSEPSRRIATLDKPERELRTWYYGNSSHVVDLAFHFAGPVEEVHGSVAGGVTWHPDAGVFAGSMKAASGALLSWHANWMGPGRWGLELVTAERRLILQPLEQLRVQSHEGFDEHPVALDLDLDRTYKPGLYRQVQAFLFGDEREYLPTVHELTERWDAFDAVRTGARWRGSKA